MSVKGVKMTQGLLFPTIFFPLLMYLPGILPPVLKDISILLLTLNELFCLHVPLFNASVCMCVSTCLSNCLSACVFVCPLTPSSKTFVVILI